MIREDDYPQILKVKMVILYLGPGIGVGGLVVLAGFAVAILFLFYAFVFLPLRQTLRKRQQTEDKAEK